MHNDIQFKIYEQITVTGAQFTGHLGKSDLTSLLQGYTLKERDIDRENEITYQAGRIQEELSNTKSKALAAEIDYYVYAMKDASATGDTSKAERARQAALSACIALDHAQLA